MILKLVPKCFDLLQYVVRQFLRVQTRRRRSIIASVGDLIGPTKHLWVIVLAAFVASVVLMLALTANSGFTRLLGLGHVFWFPLLWFLWTRLDETPGDTFFGLWLRVLITLNALSLVIDTADVIRYIAGDREER